MIVLFLGFFFFSILIISWLFSISYLSHSLRPTIVFPTRFFFLVSLFCPVIFLVSLVLLSGSYFLLFNSLLLVILFFFFVSHSLYPVFPRILVHKTHIVPFFVSRFFFFVRSFSPQEAKRGRVLKDVGLEFVHSPMHGVVQRGRRYHCVIFVAFPTYFITSKNTKKKNEERTLIVRLAKPRLHRPGETRKEIREREHRF
jgi:hypothetical protein